MTAIKYKEGGIWKTLTMPSAVHIGVSAPDPTAKQIWVDTDEGTAPSYYIPPLVTALPAAPFDGQEVRYQNAAMATDGIVWTFRYRAASASVYKWEFIGGSPLISEQGAQVSLASINTGVWIDFTPSVVLTPPLTGTYTIRSGAAVNTTVAASAFYLGVRINGTDPDLVAGDGRAVHMTATAGAWLAMAVEMTKTWTGGVGNTVLLRHRHNGAGVSTLYRASAWLSMTPVRVAAA